MTNWRFWHLISQALPTGAFQYSQGLETAVAQGWVNDGDDVEAWLRGVLHQSIGTLDLALIVRAYHALEQDDPDSMMRWDAWSLAYRETEESRSEERQMALAILKWAESLNEALPVAVESFVLNYAQLCHGREVTLDDAMTGYAWMWLENACLVAAKLIPLGHLQSQQLLHRLAMDLEQVVANAVSRSDDQLGAQTLGVWMVSAAHETHPSRLFRS